MAAIARDFDLVRPGIFAALAAKLLIIAHDAFASRMCTLLYFARRHGEFAFQ
jgi:hypothetical protein